MLAVRHSICCSCYLWKVCLPGDRRWIYIGTIITFAALPLVVVYNNRLAALWLVTMAFLVGRC